MGARIFHPPLVAGDRFGRIVVLSERGKSGHKVRGRCDCGTEKFFYVQNLRAGTTKSCGCLMRELITERNLQHGMTGTPEFEVWSSIIQRCINPKNAAYANYGGRGISMCERWRDSFEAFYEDMGPRPEGLSIDRIDNDGSYEPSNCRWATALEQRHNQRARRLKTHCKHQHEFTPENTRIRSDGSRACVTCYLRRLAARRVQAEPPELDGKVWIEMPRMPEAVTAR